MMQKLVGLGVVLLALFGCNPPVETPALNKFADAKLQRIYDLQDQRDAQSLIPFFRSKNVEYRKAAVHAFSSIQDSASIRFLKTALLTDGEAVVRRAAAHAIGQLKDSSNVGLLFMAFENELDLENRKVILEALGRSANDAVVNYFNTYRSQITQITEGQTLGMLRAIYQRKTGVLYSTQALYYLQPIFSPKTRLYAALVLRRESYNDQAKRLPNAEELQSLINAEKDDQVRWVLERMATKEQMERLAFEDFVTKYVDSLQDAPYQLAKWLAQTSWEGEPAKEWLISCARTNQHRVVRSTAAVSLSENITRDLMDDQDVQDFIRYSIASRDMALQSAACYILQKYPDDQYLDLLKTYMDSLADPGQLETIIDFKKTIAILSNQAYDAPQADLSHRIDWAHVLTIPDSLEVVISTTKGEIVMETYVEDAPGSVSNFIKLVEDSFYDGKFFHRVVPHFVVQAGCPRGDGWGGLDWVQRSEWSNYLQYETGTVGLASSGKDTEGVQFFITHNPTYFLDGRYTIFGRVTQGMDVVHRIEMGDKILSVRKK